MATVPTGERNSELTVGVWIMSSAGGKRSGTVRVVSGEWRSRRLAVPPGDRTRPMLDRVKAAVFDALGSFYGTPGRLPPLVVADVFAGGGTLGLEAISRGASAGVFFESKPAALGVLRDNLATLGVGARSVVEAVDVWSAGLCEVLLQYHCALVFLDPPYADTRDAGHGGKVMGLLDELAAFGRQAENPVLVLHHPRSVSFDLAGVEPWCVYAVRAYGTTGITILASAGRTAHPDEAAEDSP